MMKRAGSGSVIHCTDPSISIRLNFTDPEHCLCTISTYRTHYAFLKNRTRVLLNAGYRYVYELKHWKFIRYARVEREETLLLAHPQLGYF
jgi:hypothetical protein